MLKNYLNVCSFFAILDKMEEIGTLLLRLFSVSLMLLVRGTDGGGAGAAEMLEEGVEDVELVELEPGKK
jgi:hypothetical protein